MLDKNAVPLFHVRCIELPGYGSAEPNYPWKVGVGGEYPVYAQRWSADGGEHWYRLFRDDNNLAWYMAKHFEKIDAPLEVT